MAIRWRQSRARNFLRERDNVEALSELRSALRRDLDNTETLLLLARTHRRLGNLDRVSVLLNHAAAMGADSGRVERERLLVLAQTGDLRKSEPFLATMLISASEDGPDICQAFVQGFFANVRTKDALDLLDVWEESYPDDPEPIFMRAYLWQSMSQSSQAIPLYAKGLKMDPDQTIMRRRLAEALLHSQKLPEAEAQLAICVQQAPDDAQIRYVLAQCAYERGDFDLAAERIGKALQLAPLHLDARRLKGQLELARGKFDDALRELEEVVKRQPYDTFAREALGRTLRALNRPDDAKKHLDYVGQAETNMRQLDRLVRESIKVPHDAELRYEIGTILFRFGPPDDAAKWMKAAIELNPGHRGAHRALAVYFEACGDAANATYHRQLASANGRER